jgi:decaprenylphosphoryl-5-phosphoribose phosphatase
VSNPASIESASRLRVVCNAVDLALYRRVRSLAHALGRVRWVRRYSRLGEHGAVWLVIGLLGAAAAMALSRPYLGVHYPSDVAAGAALGTAIGSFGR